MPDRVPKDGDLLEACVRMVDGSVAWRRGVAHFAGDSAPCVIIALELNDNVVPASVYAEPEHMVPGRCLYGWSLEYAGGREATPGTWRWPASTKSPSAKLREIGYRVLPQCGLCLHSEFPGVSSWGSCGKMDTRGARVHASGSCRGYETSPAKAANAGLRPLQEFFDGGAEEANRA